MALNEYGQPHREYMFCKHCMDLKNQQTIIDKKTYKKSRQTVLCEKCGEIDIRDIIKFDPDRPLSSMLNLLQGRGL